MTPWWRKSHPSEVEAADVASRHEDIYANGDTFVQVYKTPACYVTSGFLQKGTLDKTEGITVKE